MPASGPLTKVHESKSGVASKLPLAIVVPFDPPRAPRAIGASLTFDAVIRSTRSNDSPPRSVTRTRTAWPLFASKSSGPAVWS